MYVDLAWHYPQLPSEQDAAQGIQSRLHASQVCGHFSWHIPYLRVGKRMSTLTAIRNEDLRFHVQNCPFGPGAAPHSPLRRALTPSTTVKEILTFSLSKLQGGVSDGLLYHLHSCKQQGGTLELRTPGRPQTWHRITNTAISVFRWGRSWSALRNLGEWGRRLVHRTAQAARLSKFLSALIKPLPKRSTILRKLERTIRSRLLRNRDRNCFSFWKFEW